MALRVALCAAMGALGACAAAPTTRIERDVVYSETLGAGARFPEPSYEGPGADGCRATTGVARSGGMLFGLHCPPTSSARSAHDAYLGLRLRNGWKVKGTRVVVLQQARGRFDLKEPSPGSDSALLTARLSADAGGEVLIEVSVTVEGPRGTDYYR